VTDTQRAAAKSDRRNPALAVSTATFLGEVTPKTLEQTDFIVVRVTNGKVEGVIAKTFYCRA
jgi:hypothetical protein